MHVVHETSQSPLKQVPFGYVSEDHGFNLTFPNVYYKKKQK